MRFLIADSEDAGARDKRRASVGQSAGESLVTFLRDLEPAAEALLTTSADADTPPWSAEPLAAFDAVFLSGSPLHVYEESAEAKRQIAFMRAVFASGTPSFGSCAGLQVAVAAAGGAVRPMEKRREAGFARRIVATEAGRDHPLLRGRPATWDAPTLHGDEVDRLPEGATLLATNRSATVQAAEIRHNRGVFWGVQYHPELNLIEIAAALRRDVAMLMEDGLVRSATDAGAHADLIATLGHDPTRVDLSWRLGVDEQVVDPAHRSREVRNFVDHLVRPTMATRGR
ncbi:glutamine amidotransferase-related protein [Sphingomonas sp.]|uniref:glutamine amidotransferase-related protein n=1 Tax=Sphingomonas sp. TaxID=28214 RepID=UPI002D803E9D|nr:gamma-glutamyl-gamma-aminobutyrate hydrolase family protein [Sphingomonas sp.]HEU0044440.1 gamma-glutamyl-gamma-aminobutyrate hydrolase family protein [Sphingomonas sp.]